MADMTAFSETIGAIYDCAIDQAAWPAALERMCGLVSSVHGSINVQDPAARTTRFAHQWGGDPYWNRQLEEKYFATIPFYPILQRCEVEEVLCTEDMVQMLGDRSVLDGPFFKEFAEPAGYCDSIGSVIIRTPQRVGTLSLTIPTSHGPVRPDELAIARQFTPHVRRAVTINDLLGQSAVQAVTFAAVLDSLATGVILVDGRGRIAYTNPAAAAHLDRGDAIQNAGGQLRALAGAAQAALAAALAQCVADQAQLGSMGIGIPAADRTGVPIALHVLPLNSGQLRRAVGAGLAAAIFICPPGRGMELPYETLAGLFALTPAEAKVMAEVAGGRSRAEAAAVLGITDETAKSHLGRVFKKTATADQGELRLLAQDYATPLRKA